MSIVVLSGLKPEKKDAKSNLYATKYLYLLEFCPALTSASRLARKMVEVGQNTWKLKFGGIGNEVPVKDIAEPVVSIIK